ncbi:MAG TPA: polysaccharide deacetylase family protein [Blastocatellia bacterium]|nr:polysaccharide deacetylase family protein [Blastocatellia bacterium]
MLKQSKKIALSTLKTFGLFTLVHNSNWRRQRLLILAYHGISLEDEDQCDPSLFMSQPMFRERVQLLKKHRCTVLPLNEAIQRLYANDLPERCVAVTFDDGNYDFYKQAYPILSEYQIPVTLYLSTFYTYYNRPVFDTICRYLLWKGRETELNLQQLTGQKMELNLSTEAARATAAEEILAFARRQKLSAEEKDALAAQLAGELRIDYGALLKKRIMQQVTPDEVKQLAAAGVDIQLHTHRHRTPQDRQLFVREIEDNRNSILAITGSRADHLCYPSGVYDQAFFPWLNDLGVVSATTCDPGLASRDSYQLLLPRFIDTSLQSSIEFEGWLTGVAALLPRRQDA